MVVPRQSLKYCSQNTTVIFLFPFENLAEWSSPGWKQLVFLNANFNYSVTVTDFRWKNRELSGVNQISAVLPFYAYC